MPYLRASLLFLTLLMFTSCATAQPGKENKPTLKKKDQRLLAQAQAALDLRNFAEARVQLDKLIEGNPEQARLYYLRSIAFKETGDFSSAIKDVETGIGRKPGGDDKAYRELGELYGKNGQFVEAVRALETYASSSYVSKKTERQGKAETLLDNARTARDLAANPVPFTPILVPGGINTPEDMEYFPSLSPDGQVMIFTRRVNGRQEDFYLSEKKDDGTWSVAEPIDGVNTEFNEGAQSITADGNYLIFTACDRADGAGSCDLYYSERNEEGRWAPAQNLGPEVNTRDYEAQPSISADGTLLFFASRRPGGLGGADIYLSGRLPSGKWSRPVNLGETVNTKGNELYPFWAPDGATLYFTSNGHSGMGGDDLFRSGLSPENKWLKPINLGYPINTSANETNLFVALDGEMAYFSKGEIRPETGEMDVDIYQFELPEDLRPAPSTFVKATVTDVETGRPLIATIRLRALDQTAPATSRQTDKTGSFLAVLPAGKDYAFTVNLDGYLFYSDRFALAGGLIRDEPYVLEIKLQPVKKEVVENDRAEADGAIAFRNVLFASGSTELLPVSGDELDRLSELLNRAPNYSVEIVGHTDDVGEESTNLLLSQQRAESVKNYLVDQGIAPARIMTRGTGEASPIASNDTEEGRASNRRTTFRLMD